MFSIVLISMEKCEAHLFFESVVGEGIHPNIVDWYNRAGSVYIIVLKRKGVIRKFAHHAILARVIGYSGRKGIVNGRFSVVSSRIPSIKFSI
jgi:hypothetical protein